MSESALTPSGQPEENEGRQSSIDPLIGVEVLTGSIQVLKQRAEGSGEDPLELATAYLEDLYSGELYGDFTPEDLSEEQKSERYAVTILLGGELRSDVEGRVATLLAGTVDAHQKRYDLIAADDEPMKREMLSRASRAANLYTEPRVKGGDIAEQVRIASSNAASAVENQVSRDSVLMSEATKQTMEIIDGGLLSVQHINEDLEDAIEHIEGGIHRSMGEEGHLLRAASPSEEHFAAVAQKLLEGGSALDEIQSGLTLIKGEPRVSGIGLTERQALKDALTSNFTTEGVSMQLRFLNDTHGMVAKSGVIEGAMPVQQFGRTAQEFSRVFNDALNAAVEAAQHRRQAFRSVMENLVDSDQAEST